MAYSQTKRLIGMQSSLGEDVLLLQSFSGHEGISQLFRFSADLLSENRAISFKDIVGKQVTLQIHHIGNDKRYWNGFVSRFACVGGDNRFSYYRAEIVPWASRTTASRIFKTALRAVTPSANTLSNTARLPTILSLA